MKKIIVFLLLVAFFSNACGKTKDLNIPDIYKEKIDIKNGYIHFSIDDVNNIFYQLTENEYKSIFEHPLLKYIKELHDKYGIVVSLFTYYESDGFSLKDTTDEYSEEFEKNSDWLKFGFHAKNASAYQDISATENIMYYNLTIKELLRITGSQNCIDHFVRLDRFCADSRTLEGFQNCREGICGVFIAEWQKEYRQSYSMSQEEMHLCYQNDIYKGRDGLLYTPTDVRLENINSDKEFYQLLIKVSDEPNIIIFTHEWQFQGENADEIKKYMEWFAQFGREYKVPFEFPQEMIGE